MEALIIVILIAIIWYQYSNKDTNIRVDNNYIDHKYADALTTIGKLESEHKELKRDLNRTNNSLKEAQGLLEAEKKQKETALSQRKSSEFRIGTIAENLVPLLKGLPYDPQNLHHMSQPIDFIYYDYESAEIVFIEVKSGKSKESKRQKIIKNAIKMGKVYYEELRIDEKGITVKRAQNNE